VISEIKKQKRLVAKNYCCIFAAQKADWCLG